MSKLVGCALILSGVALAAVTLPFADSSDARPAHASDIIEIVAASAPARTSVAKDVQTAGVPIPGALGVDRERPRKAVPHRDLGTIEAQPRKPVAPFHTVTVPNDPVAIARALQAELRRVGCYEGEINGVWSPMAKKAMKTFTGRVNASLPVDHPDYILLTLVQGHSEKVCGVACPAGQAPGEEGRCLPLSVLANAAKKAQPQPVVVASTAPAHTLNSAKAPSAQISVPLAAAPAPFVSETPRMALAGPTAPVESGQAVKPEKPELTAAEKARARELRALRERRIAAEHRKPPVTAGQTRWAREFFRTIY